MKKMLPVGLSTAAYTYLAPAIRGKLFSEHDAHCKREDNY